MKIQVLFGSRSDERVYGPLCSFLESLAEVKMEVASAHRHPGRVREIMSSSDADVFIAGAGLAAHLPGVVASMTLKPVFGVAVNGAFSGFDAFMSIAQMPKDIPVMAVMENHAQDIKDFLTSAVSWNKNTLKLAWNPLQEASPLLARILNEIQEKSGQKVERVEALSPECQAEIVMHGDKKQGRGLCLFVCEKEILQKPQTALEFFEEAQSGGFWVGANNTTNLVLQIKKIKELAP
jgi:5-(carboxyamino)imidazole ribonucleotide mutase